MPLTTEQKQQLVAVYDEAEKSGDTAAMERVRQVLAQDKQAPAQSGDINAVLQETFGGTPETLGSQFAEAGRRVAGAVRQSIGGAQDMYNLFVKGKPYYNPETRQYETTSKFNANTINEKTRRQLSDIEAKEAGIDPEIRNAGAEIINATGQAVAPELALGRSTTITGNIIRQGTTGAVQAALQFNPENKSTDVILSAGLPAAFGTFASLSAGVSNIIARRITAAQSARTARAVASAAETLPRTERTFTLAQRSGIPELQTLEQAAYNSDLVRAYADQNDTLVAELSTVFRQPVREGQNLETDFVTARARARGLLDQQRTVSRNLWQQGMNRVRQLDASAGSPRVPANYTAQQFQQEQEDASNALRAMKKLNIRPASWRAMENLLAAQRTPAQPPVMDFSINRPSRPVPQEMTVTEYADLLQGLTQLQRETDDQRVIGFATRMRRAIDQDISSLGNYTGRAERPVAELLQVRAEYQRQKLLEQTMRDSATYKLLGVGQPKDAAMPAAEELLGNYAKLSREGQRSFTAWADENSPGILNTMRQGVISNAVRNARTITGARDSQQSLDQLTTALFDKNAGFDLRTSGLWTPSQQAQMEGVRNALRVIANQRTEGRAAGTPVKVEDIAINLISRSGPFLARQISRVLYGANAARFFSDPRALEYLTRIRATSGPTQVAARSALMELLQEDYGASPNSDDTANSPQP